MITVFNSHLKNEYHCCDLLLLFCPNCTHQLQPLRLLQHAYHIQYAWTTTHLLLPICNHTLASPLACNGETLQICCLSLSLFSCLSLQLPLSSSFLLLHLLSLSGFQTASPCHPTPMCWLCGWLLWCWACRYATPCRQRIQKRSYSATTTTIAPMLLPLPRPVCVSCPRRTPLPKYIL